MRRSAGARSRRASAPGRWRSEARRASSTALVGQTRDRHPATRQVPGDRPRPRPGRRQSDAHGSLPAGAPGRRSCRPRPRSCCGFGRATGRRRRRGRALDAGRGVAARRRRAPGGPLPRPDPDGQGLSPAGGVDRRVPGLGDDEIGPDADDPALTLEVWRERIRRHPGELKNLLRNQAFVAGIGNAYSDEVLHAARLLPFRKRSTLARRGGRRAVRRRCGRRSPTPSTSCASASRRPSRRRCATSSRST